MAALCAIVVGLLLCAIPGRSLCPAGAAGGWTGAVGDTLPAAFPPTLLRDLPYAMEPLPGVVTAGQPLESDFALLRRAGIRTVVDLRLPAEPRGFDEPAAARAAGLAYVNIPFLRNAMGPEEIEAFRAVLRDPSKRPLLVHCTATNRVGGILVPWLILDEGRAESDAIALAMKVGMRSHELLDAALRYVQEVRERPV